MGVNTGSVAFGQVGTIVSAGDKPSSDHSLEFTYVYNSLLQWTFKPPRVEIVGSAQMVVPTAGVNFVDEIEPNQQTKLGVVDQGAELIALLPRNDSRQAGAYWAWMSAEAEGRWSATGAVVDGVVIVDTNMWVDASVFTPDAPPGAYGKAGVAVLDPFSFAPLAAGESIAITSTLSAGQSMQAMWTAGAERVVSVGTDLPGYETLYSLTLRVTEENFTQALVAEFVSHPLLGLDDAAIAAAAAAAFAYNANQSAFVLGNDFLVFDGALPLPTGQAFDLYINDEASVVVVPEPGTLALLAMGGLLLGRRRWA
jgi:hypothetical protein